MIIVFNVRDSYTFVPRKASYEMLPDGLRMKRKPTEVKRTIRVADVITIRMDGWIPRIKRFNHALVDNLPQLAGLFKV